MQITDKCTGCGACSVICPKRCISMTNDMYGESKPTIDDSICIHCGLCKKTCPQENQLPLNYPIECYAAWSKDDKDLIDSASGAFATVVYKYALQQNINAYGCDYTPDIDLKHFQIQNKDDILKCKSSKYSKSNSTESFTQIKKQLNDGQKVLFIGTPCQVAGLLASLGKKYDDLITIDLVCHGTPPTVYLKEHLSSINQLKTAISKIRFRGEYDQMLTIWDDHNEICYQKDRKADNYYKAFYDNMISMDCCYYCDYARNERVSDITIGDFWGLGALSTIEARSNRPSLILINSERGKKLFSAVAGQLVYEKRDVLEGIRGNGRLNRYPGKNGKAKAFRKLYPVFGFTKSVLIANIVYGLVHSTRKEK